MWGQNIGTREVPLLKLFFILRTVVLGYYFVTYALCEPERRSNSTSPVQL